MNIFEIIAFIVALAICCLIGWIIRINNKFPEHTETDYISENNIDIYKNKKVG